MSWGYVGTGSNPQGLPTDPEIKQALIDKGPLGAAVISSMTTHGRTIMVQELFRSSPTTQAQ